MRLNNFSYKSPFVGKTIRNLILMIAVCALLCAGGTTVYGVYECPPSSPAESNDDILLAINGSPSPKCIQWYKNNDPTLKNWAVGGSHNLPLIGALIGLYRFPSSNMIWSPKPAGSRNINPTKYQITYVNWWIWFLASQPGQDPMQYHPATFNRPPDRTNLKYFKGTEQFSNVYDAHVVYSVIAVRYWAYKNNNTALQTLTSKYLRANWALYALSAAEGPAWLYNIPGRTTTSKQYKPTAPRKKDDLTLYIYKGSFLALANTRAKLAGHWKTDDKFPLFGRAIGYTAPAGQSYENNDITKILNALLPKWDALANRPPAESLYGLTEADRDSLRNIKVNGNLASTFLPWLDDLRVPTPYHLLGWDGWRGYMMEDNVHGNTPNMYGVVYRKAPPSDPTHPLATFLFPYTDKLNSGAAHGGLAELLPGKMRATNAPSDAHPQNTIEAEIPTTQPQCHVVLTPNQAPYLDTSSPSTWPPPKSPTPPATTTPPEPFAVGDTSWVADGNLPNGSITVGDNDSWNWIDAEADVSTENAFVHQSSSFAGFHQHYFHSATEALTINAGDVMYAYVKIDPTNLPTELMLQWWDPTAGWEHRAFWGQDQLAWGTKGTSSRRYMGPLPVAGEWVRLEVPASIVGLEGRTINGMAFTLVGGQVTWDEAGKNDAGGTSQSVAVGMPVAQSSTYGNLPASNAVDGNPDGDVYQGSVSHTDYGAQPWWRVDLGSSYSIPWVNLWNRIDCCSERLSNFYLLVSDVPFGSNDLTASLNQPGVSSYYVSGPVSPSTSIPVGRTGRYLRVQLSGSNYLSLAEVEVYGVPAPAPTPTPTPTPTPPPTPTPTPTPGPPVLEI